ncbi:MAG TPA: A24 family peptidase [Candidatus Dormibacteraeota bacterium]
MNPIAVALVWGIAGAACGWFARWGSVKLARLEGLEPGFKTWQVYGPPILAAVLFAVFGYELHGALALLALRSLFVLVLVQVIFFDFEHHIILDRIMFPAMAVALVVSLFAQPWWAGLATGFGAGLLFFVLAVLGSAVLKQEALGFGDVKLAAFMGLLLGVPLIFSALFYGVLFAGLGAIVFIVWHRSVRGNIAYGPYLAAGALLALYFLP